MYPNKTIEKTYFVAVLNRSLHHDPELPANVPPHPRASVGPSGKRAPLPSFPSNDEGGPNGGCYVPEGGAGYPFNSRFWPGATVTWPYNRGGGRMLHCNGKVGHGRPAITTTSATTPQWLKNFSNNSNGCIVHPDCSRSLWWLHPDPDFTARSSWPKPSEPHHDDVINVLSDANDSVDGSNNCEEGEPPVKPVHTIKSPCCNVRDLHHPVRHSSFPQPIFRPICSTTSSQRRASSIARQTLTRQNCVDVQISYPRVVTASNHAHKSKTPTKSSTKASTKINADIMIDYPSCPNVVRPFNQIPYHVLSPHSQCQSRNSNVCRRIDSLTSSSSSCCRRPDSSCSCQHPQQQQQLQQLQKLHRYRFKSVDHNNEPVYDRVISWLKITSRDNSKWRQIINSSTCLCKL